MSNTKATRYPKQNYFYPQSNQGLTYFDTFYEIGKYQKEKHTYLILLHARCWLCRSYEAADKYTLFFCIWNKLEKYRQINITRFTAEQLCYDWKKIMKEFLKN